jgi:hypothetical protein
MSHVHPKFEWFINKFSPDVSRLNANSKGFILAKEFRRVGDKTIKNNQYRQLMKLAVPDFATDNGMTSSHSKYAIRFNSSPVTVTLFDENLLTHQILKFLPPLYLLEVNPDTGEITDGEDWKTHNIYWSSIIESLIVYENTGEFKTNFSSRDEQFFIIEVKKWIYVYEILKYGWDKIKSYENLKYERDNELAHTLKHQNHNDCFKYTLMCASESHWRNRRVDLVNRPYMQRKILDNINNTKNNGVNEKDIKALLKDINWERNKISDHCAALNWLIEAAQQIQNDEVKRALIQLLETRREIKEAVYLIVNRRSAPKRQENYNKKHNT